MFIRKYIPKLVILVLLGTLVIGQPVEAFAWGRHGGHHSHHRHYSSPKIGYILGPLFLGAMIASMNQPKKVEHYYYTTTPVYSTPTTVVNATQLPVGYHTIIAGGNLYFYADNVYYVRVVGGYQIVPAPDSIVISSQLSGLGTRKGLLINLPNQQGTYTTVFLKRSGDGFIGPQGELYSDKAIDIDRIKRRYAN